VHRIIRYAFLAVALVIPAAAGSIDFTGVFSQDSDAQLFAYSVQNQGTVTVATTSYQSGGFSPILSVFDSTGQFLFDDAGYGNNTDASLTWNSLAGMQYIVTLTEWDNLPNAANDDGNLSEGFVEAGNGNFTANPPFSPTPLPGGFYTGPGGSQLSGNWAVTFSAADAAGLTASALPEPASFALVLAGAGLILARKRLPRGN
jgi:hypothetical protein